MLHHFTEDLAQFGHRAFVDLLQFQVLSTWTEMRKIIYFRLAPCLVEVVELVNEQHSCTGFSRLQPMEIFKWQLRTEKACVRFAYLYATEIVEKHRSSDNSKAALPSDSLDHVMDFVDIWKSNPTGSVVYLNINTFGSTVQDSSSVLNTNDGWGSNLISAIGMWCKTQWLPTKTVALLEC